MAILRLNSMLGVIELEEQNGALVRCSLLPDAAPELEAIPRREAASPVLAEAEQQLNEYFAHLRREFDLPLCASGTPFQKEVWAQLFAIPYGETRTYGQLAAAVGRPKGARAVGMACHANPLWLIVPCHRVVGAGGALTGYACGVEVKQALLEWEQE
jgi:methylated-DNA-[protein]-cysteine S-methyltransferase